MFTKYDVLETNNLSLSNKLRSFCYTELDNEPSLLHSHVFSEIVIPCTNYCNLIVLDKTIPMKCGQIYLTLPHLMHTETKQNTSPACYYTVKINGLLLNYERKTTSLIALPYEKKYPELKTYLDMAKKHFERNDNRLATLDLQSFLFIFSNLIQENGYMLTSSNSQPISSIVSDATHYIANHYSDDIKMADLAQKFNVSHNLLLLKFKKETGCSPKEYLMEKRMDAAVYLLKTTDFSITQISTMCGFTLPAHFSYTFKKHHGVTPKEYKRLIQSPPPPFYN